MRLVMQLALGLTLITMLAEPVCSQRPNRPSQKRARATKAARGKAAAAKSSLTDRAAAAADKKGQARRLLNDLLNGKPVSTSGASVDQLNQLMQARHEKITELVKRLHAVQASGKKPSAETLQQAQQLQRLISSPKFARLRATIARKRAAQASNGQTPRAQAKARLQRRIAESRRQGAKNHAAKKKHHAKKHHAKKHPAKHHAKKRHAKRHHAKKHRGHKKSSQNAVERARRTVKKHQGAQKRAAKRKPTRRR